MPSPDPKDEYIIDQIMPTRAFHLLGGPSGVGKSTLLVQSIKDWTGGQRVFGYESYPRPAVYVSADRSQRSFERTLNRVGSTLGIPSFSLVDRNIPRDMKSIMKESRRLDPKAEVLFIEPITALIPGGRINDYGAVSEWISTDVCRRCENDNWTIWASGHTPKLKLGEEYRDPRQRLIGSVAWAGFIETIYILERGKDASPLNQTRILYILPRNAAEFELRYRLNDQGLFVLDTSELDEATFILDQQVAKLEIGRPYPTEVFYAWTKLGFSLHVVKGYLVSAQERGRLEKIKLGVYRRPYRT